MCYCYYHHRFRSRVHKWLNTWYLVFWALLISLDMMISSPIHFPANDIISFFMTEYVYIYIYHIFFIHSLVFWPFG
jgi:hypothetical protein